MKHFLFASFFFFFYCCTVLQYYQMVPETFVFTLTEHWMLNCYFKLYGEEISKTLILKPLFYLCHGGLTRKKMHELWVSRRCSNISTHTLICISANGIVCKKKIILSRKHRDSFWCSCQTGARFVVSSQCFV